MTSTEIMEALRFRYAPPAWAFFEQLRDGTGLLHSRTADAVAMNVWPSQGLELHGFEIKVTRGDWLREKKRPEKAEAIMAYCDRVFLVTGEKGLIKPEELPPGWGLIEPHGSGLRQTKAADKNPHATPLDRVLFASLMREGHRYIEREIAEKDGTKAAREEGYKEAEQRFEHTLERATQDAKSLRDSIAEFEKVSGVQISVWDAGRVAEAVKTVLSGGHLNYMDRLRKLREDIDKAIRSSEQDPSP